MELGLAIAGFVIALASPVASFFGARYGHRSAVRTAEVAAEATREGHHSAERIAASAHEKQEADNRRDAFWRAIDYISKADDKSQKLGLDLLAGLLNSGKLDETYQRMALEVVAPINQQTVMSLAPADFDNVARDDLTGEPG